MLALEYHIIFSHNAIVILYNIKLSVEIYTLAFGPAFPTSPFGPSGPGKPLTKNNIKGEIYTEL